MSTAIFLALVVTGLHDSPPPAAAAGTITAFVGSNEACRTFGNDAEHRILKVNESLDLRIVNRCREPRRIRIDRIDKKDFSERCRSVGPAFLFESDENVFGPGEERKVVCTVAANDERRHRGIPSRPAYKFQVLAGSPDSAVGQWDMPEATPTPTRTIEPGKAVPTATSESHPEVRPLSHSLEVEVDP